MRTSSRDLAIFGLGMLGLVVELSAWLFVGRTPDPTLTVAFSALLGVPTVLNRDEKRQQ